MFVGVASSSSGASAAGQSLSPGLGGGPFFLGSMANFLSAVNLSTGEVPGCLTPTGASPTLYHAKPMIIQGAFLAAKANGGNYSFYKPYQAAMQALLAYWERPPRLHTATGLHAWHDQLETGADDLVYSTCPSAHSPECWSEAQAYTLASPDLEVFIAREHIAYSLFLQSWAGAAWEGEAAEHRRLAGRAADALNLYLWDAQVGMYQAYNLSTGQPIVARTYQAAWPLWAGLANSSQIVSSLTTLSSPDLWTPYGIRSTSSTDPRYSNANIINPYSNWRGPVWANVNAVMAYAMVRLARVYPGQPWAQTWAAAGLQLGQALLHTLAEDIRVSGTWHECYHSETGAGLAAPGFLSWNTLGAALLPNLQAGVDPFDLTL